MARRDLTIDEQVLLRTIMRTILELEVGCLVLPNLRQGLELLEVVLPRHLATQAEVHSERLRTTPRTTTPAVGSLVNQQRPTRLALLEGGVACLEISLPQGLVLPQVRQ